MANSIVFNQWSSDGYLLDRFFKVVRDYKEYCVDSNHTETSFINEGGSNGFVFVGTPSRCPDYIDRMLKLKRSYLERGYRTSPESIKPNEGIAGFAWVAPRRRI